MKTLHGNIQGFKEAFAGEMSQFLAVKKQWTLQHSQ